MINLIKLFWANVPNWARDFVTAIVWALALLALVLIILKVGDYQGAKREQQACQAAVTANVEQAHQRYVADIDRGQKDVARLTAERNQLAAERDALQERLKHVPKTVPTARCPDPGAVHLTLAAVRLWNADLGYPDLPAGACGADDGSAGVDAADGPCAGDSGIGLDQVERNAKKNFRDASAIRAQCQALINNLKGREQRQSIPPIGDTKP